MGISLTTTYKTNTVASVSGTAFNSNGTPFVAGDVGRFIRMVDGPAQGQTRLIAGFVSSTQVTLQTAWNSPTVVGVTENLPVAGNTWVMSYTLDDIDDGINIIKRSASQYEFAGTAHTIGGATLATATFIADQRKTLLIDSNQIQLGANACLQFGRPSADGTYAVEGCTIVDAASSVTQTYQGFAISAAYLAWGDVQLYGCQVICPVLAGVIFWRQNRSDVSVCRLIDTRVFGPWGCRIRGNRAAVRNLEMFGQTDASVGLTAGGTVGLLENVQAKASTVAFYWNAVVAPGSVSASFRAKDLTTAVLAIGNGSVGSASEITINNPILDEIEAAPAFAFRPGTVSGAAMSAVLRQSLAVAYQQVSGTAINGARIYATDSAGNIVIDTTPAGNSTSASVRIHQFSNLTGLAGTTSFASGTSFRPITVKARHFGYLFNETQYDGRAPGTLALAGVLDTRVAAANKAAALAVAGIAVSSTTITITANVTAQQVFDYCKAWLVDNPAEADFLPAALNFGSQNITINNATMTMGGLVTTGTVSLAGTGAASGPYTDASGLHVNIRADSLLTGSRVQLYNVTDATELLNTETTGAGLVFPIIAPATAKTIRLRVAKVGYMPVEALGVLDGASVSFLDSQALDTTYLANGIDGSTVAGLTPDYPNLQIDANIAGGGITVQAIYAWTRWANTTADGIRLMHNVVQAQDGANYLIDTAVVDAKFDNNSVTPLVINGGYIRRSDGLTVIGEGAIQLDPGRAYVAAGATAITVPAGERVVTLASGGFLARG